MFSSLSKKTFIKLPIGQLPRRRRKLPTDSGPSCVLRWNVWVAEMDLIGQIDGPRRLGHSAFSSVTWLKLAFSSVTRPSVSEMDLIGRIDVPRPRPL